MLIRSLRAGFHGFFLIRSLIASPLWRVYARLRGATVDPSVIFGGRPLVRCPAGAKLILSNGVRINSSVASNPIIGRSRSTLNVVARGGEIILEANVGGSGVCITAAKSIRIGEGTLLGADCFIADTDFHRPLAGNRLSNDSRTSAKPIVIGKGCFIGARSMILKVVTIGDGSVVGAGAVVSIDVPANYMAFGNPAVIRPLKEDWIHPAS